MSAALTAIQLAKMASALSEADRALSRAMSAVWEADLQSHRVNRQLMECRVAIARFMARIEVTVAASQDPEDPEGDHPSTTADTLKTESTQNPHARS